MNGIVLAWSGIPKPLVYTNEFIMNFMTVATLEPSKGFQSLLVCLQSGYFFNALPPFHVSLQYAAHHSLQIFDSPDADLKSLELQLLFGLD